MNVYDVASKLYSELLQICFDEYQEFLDSNRIKNMTLLI